MGNNRGATGVIVGNEPEPALSIVGSIVGTVEPARADPFVQQALDHRVGGSHIHNDPTLHDTGRPRSGVR